MLSIFARQQTNQTFMAIIKLWTNTCYRGSYIRVYSRSVIFAHDFSHCFERVIKLPAINQQVFCWNHSKCDHSITCESNYLFHRSVNSRYRIPSNWTPGSVLVKADSVYLKLWSVFNEPEPHIYKSFHSLASLFRAPFWHRYNDKLIYTGFEICKPNINR